MNKEQSADDPSVDLIRVKNMLCALAPFLVSYPTLVIACIEHKGVSGIPEQLRQRYEAR